MRRILTGAAIAILAGTTFSTANADCTCRARGGVQALMGQTLCIATPNGLRLARCDKVLNNTSWTFLDEPCPQALLDQLSNTQTARSSHAGGHPVAQ